jgi:hypothetical protein
MGEGMAIELVSYVRRTQLEDEGPETRERERDDYVVCRAETAECTCPDACERDHGND